MERVRVVLSAAVTWLVFAATVVTIVLQEVDVPAVTRFGGYALTVIGVAVAIIRRVTPVLPSERGVLER